MRYTPFRGEVKSTGSKKCVVKTRQLVIVVLGQENANILLDMICYVLDAEHDIQLFPPKIDIKTF